MPVPSNSTADSKEVASDKSQHNNGNSKSLVQKPKFKRLRKDCI